MIKKMRNTDALHKSLLSLTYTNVKEKSFQ